jgi:hypothetical protein
MRLGRVSDSFRLQSMRQGGVHRTYITAGISIALLKSEICCSTGGLLPLIARRYTNIAQFDRIALGRPVARKGGHSKSSGDGT